MRIGIIGTGNMASALGKQWAGSGHRVFFGSRTPERARAVASSIGANADAGSVREAAEFAEVVLLATVWAGTEASLKAAGPLAGKVLIDCTNPLTPDSMALEVGYTTSGAEEVAKWVPGARVVKAFNAVAARAIHTSPVFGGHAATIFCCGDDAAAKAIVLTLAEEIGFEGIDAGPLRNARCLEPMAQLWIQLAYVQGLGPDMAFKLIQR